MAKLLGIVVHLDDAACRSVGEFVSARPTSKLEGAVGPRDADAFARREVVLACRAADLLQACEAGADAAISDRAGDRSGADLPGGQ